MIILPPEELTVYLSVGENGEWIHDPDMPTELEEIFQKFVKEERPSEIYRCLYLYERNHR